MDDNEIVDLFRKRSENALSALEGAYGRLARSAARAILRDERDVEECLNDSFLVMWNRIPAENPACLPAFFVSVTRKIALKIVRYRDAAKRGIVPEEYDDGSAVSRETRETMGIVSDVLSDFLGRLDTRSRVLFLRRYYLGESVAEAARATGITENHAGVKLLRLRAKLKKELEKEGITI